jgi:hypothetical protein
MNVPDEHDDDLEPEVIEGADIETVTYPDDDELGENEPRCDRTHSSGRVNEPDGRVVHDERDDDSSDTI